MRAAFAREIPLPKNSIFHTMCYRFVIIFSALCLSAGLSTAAGPGLTFSLHRGPGLYHGQTGAPYSLIVSNVGTSPTTSAAALSDTLPAGLTATSIAGSGWT